ncbi:MAG: hypothetical protein HZC40_24180 [Chloroflexi bacterium]|nr:hypothetical protein [Chloroflexota bacterium]
MSTLTIEHNSVKLPIEMVAGDGMVILTLVPNAYLVLRASDLATYPPEKLERLQTITRELTQPPEPSYNYHPTKVRALREMRAKGIAVSSGEEYGLKPSSVSLEQVRQGLASIQGSLADRIIAERDEQ